MGYREPMAGQDSSGGRAPGARVLLLGGSGELGRVLVSTLVGEGARVAFTWHVGEAVAARLREAHPGLLGAKLDLTDVRATRAAVEALAGELGGLDALVHAAALGSAGDGGFDTLASPTEEGWDSLMSVNVKSVFFACQAAAPFFGEEGGNIVFLGSIDGVKTVPSPAPYAASKGAVSALARSLAKELGPRKLRVNVVAPGILESGASRVIPEHVRAEYLKHSGAHRFGQHEEVARVVAFFALRNTYVTGQSLCLDGGL